MDGWIDGWTDGWTDRHFKMKKIVARERCGWMDGWMVI